MGYKWKYISRKKIYISLSEFAMLTFFMAFLYIIMIKSQSERYSSTLLSHIIGFLTIIIVGFFMLSTLYYFNLRYDINVKKIKISMKNLKYKIKDSIYLQLVSKIEQNLKQNKDNYQKIEERKIGWLLPYITFLNINSKNISIRIIRNKYVINVNIGNIKPDNEIYFEQVLKKLIENGIESVANEFKINMDK